MKQSIKTQENALNTGLKRTNPMYNNPRKVARLVGLLLVLMAQ